MDEHVTAGVDPASAVAPVAGPGATQVDALEVEEIDADELAVGELEVPELEPDGVAVDEPEVDASMLDDIERELADIERALVLLDEGTYGRCEVCGDSIDEALLTERPVTRFCAAHLPIGLD